MDLVVVRAGALGDLLLLRRAVAALQAAGHRVHLLAPDAPARALVGTGAGEVLDVLAWDGPETASILAGEATRGPLAAALDAADAVLAYTRSDAVRDALGARVRRFVAWDPQPPLRGPHASRWLARAVRALGVEDHPDPPPLTFTAAELQEARVRTAALPNGFVAVHPGSGSPRKNWSPARFAEAAARLAAGSPGLLVLGPADEEPLDWPPAVTARDWPLRTLAAALARAGVFLGNDSGVAHLAAAAGTPTVTLFGPTDPTLWAPVGAAVSALRAPSGSLDAIGVDEVVGAANRLRSAASGPPSGR